MLILFLELMAKTQGFMGNQLYRPYRLQGVVIQYNLKFTAVFFFQKFKKQYLGEVA